MSNVIVNSYMYVLPESDGSMEYLETYTLGSSSSSFTWTFATGAITLADVSKVVVVVNMQKSSTASTIFCKYNSQGNSTYNNAVETVNSSGVGGYYNSARFYGWDLFEVNNTYNIAGTFDILKNVVTGKMHMTKNLSGEGGFCGGSGYNTGTGLDTPITLFNLYFEANTGNINAGSKFDLFKVNRA